MPKPSSRIQAAVLVVVLMIPFAYSYLGGFVADQSTQCTTRHRAAERLAQLSPSGLTLGLPRDPAPYDLPPVDLSRWRVMLLPESGAVSKGVDVIVIPVDVRSSSLRFSGYTRELIEPRTAWFANRLSWADKPIEIWIRTSLISRDP